MTQASGRQLLAAAAIVGVAVIAGSLLLADALNGVAGQLAEIRTAGVDAKDVLARSPAAPAQAARRGPDPNRRYKVSTEGAPSIGPATAAVTLIEFSDFQ